MQTEMMSEAIDDSLDNDEAEEETEELTNQVIISSSSIFNWISQVETCKRMHPLWSERIYEQ